MFFKSFSYMESEMDMVGHYNKIADMKFRINFSDTSNNLPYNAPIVIFVCKNPSITFNKA